MVSKFAAPVAALIASAAAQSACTFQATTVTDQQGASVIAGCTAISGNVVFATGAAAPTLSLDQVESVDGDIVYTQDRTVSLIAAPKLTTVSGAIKFNNLTALNSISLPAIEKTGDVQLINLAALQTVTTGTQYDSAGAVQISNTQLSTLGGFGNLSSVSDMAVSGNTLLADITMNIGTVKSITIGSNQEANRGLNVAFDNLTMANMVTVQNATAVSFKALKNVTGAFNLIFNNFQTFSAPNLTVAGGISLIGNPQLDNMSFPQLTELNGEKNTFLISNNTKLTTIGGFDQLTTVRNDINFAGTFQNITSIKQLKRVGGTMIVSSTSDIANSVCQDVNNLKKSLVVAGKASCSGQSKSAASNAGGSGTSSDGGSSSSAAAGIVSIPALPTLSAGFGAFLLQFLLSF